MKKLSDRLRPNVECAPWVIDEVKKLEDQLKGMNMERVYQFRNLKKGVGWTNSSIAEVEQMKKFLKFEPDLGVEFRTLVVEPTELERARRVELVSLLQSAVSGCTRYHTEYMGKEMPDREYESFKRLRDETIPRLRAELIAALTQGD